LLGRDGFRAASLLLLFLPETPLLFMGQEWASAAPFLYFCDHEGQLGQAVSAGRRQEFAHFSAFRAAAPEAVPDPQAESSFLNSKLDWSERSLPDHAQTLSLYRRALELRRTDPVLRQATEMQVGTLGTRCGLLRRAASDERLLLFNAGRAITLKEVAGRSEADARPLLSSSGASGRSAFELAASRPPCLRSVRAARVKGAPRGG